MWVSGRRSQNQNSYASANNRLKNVRYPSQGRTFEKGLPLYIGQDSTAPVQGQTKQAGQFRGKGYVES